MKKFFSQKKELLLQLFEDFDEKFFHNLKKNIIVQQNFLEIKKF